MLERCERLSADKGYDDGKLLERLWDEHEINLVIDIHNLWQDGEGDEAGAITKLVAGQQNVLYTFGGQVPACVWRAGKCAAWTTPASSALAIRYEIPLPGAGGRGVSEPG